MHEGPHASCGCRLHLQAGCRLDDLHLTLNSPIIAHLTFLARVCGQKYKFLCEIHYYCNDVCFNCL